MSLPVTLPSKYHQPVIKMIAFALILLFVYTALSKWLAFDDFKMQMHNQAVPYGVAEILIWTLPGFELVVGILLATDRWRSAALKISMALLVLFTGYIALVLAGVFDRVPCSCGGVLQVMGWKTHLLFNIFFLLLSGLAIYLVNRERRMVGTA